MKTYLPMMFNGKILPDEHDSFSRTLWAARQFFPKLKTDPRTLRVIIGQPQPQIGGAYFGADENDPNTLRIVIYSKTDRPDKFAHELSHLCQELHPRIHKTLYRAVQGSREWAKHRKAMEREQAAWVRAYKKVAQQYNVDGDGANEHQVQIVGAFLQSYGELAAG